MCVIRPVCSLGISDVFAILATSLGGIVGKLCIVPVFVVCRLLCGVYAMIAVLFCGRAFA